MSYKTLGMIAVAGSLAAFAAPAAAGANDAGRAGADGRAQQVWQHSRDGALAGFAEARGRFHRGMQTLDAFDADGDGAVTEAEITAVRTDRLNSFDTDGDSRLTLQEYAALWGDAMREEMVDRFQSHDDDDDGAVTLDEFNDDVRRGRSEEEAAELAAVRADRHGAFDADGDGVLTVAEYEPLWMDAMRPRMVDQFQSHDDDGDAIVTAEEFAARWIGAFDHIDRDNNGVVDDDDFGGHDRNAPNRGGRGAMDRP